MKWSIIKSNSLDFTPFGRDCARNIVVFLLHYLFFHILSTTYACMYLYQLCICNIDSRYIAHADAEKNVLKMLLLPFPRGTNAKSSFHKRFHDDVQWWWCNLDVFFISEILFLVSTCGKVRTKKCHFYF